MGNKNLQEAKKNKNDEFYTQYDTIQNEVDNYKEHFRGKTVMCNCDDPYESNFCKYFMMRFERFGLKRLICTSYAHSPIMGKDRIPDADGEMMTDKRGYVLDITEVPHPTSEEPNEKDAEAYIRSGIVKKLEGDGSFESKECVGLLKQADIVVTNPPFSRFRDYVGLLIKEEKGFLIIGNKNAVTYKEIFPLIKDGKIWLGIEQPANFITPNGETQNVNGIPRWYTNLDHKKRHEPLQLMTMEDNLRFSKKIKSYPRYDNYDAIEVPLVKGIPSDYDGAMGVPITFLDKYCPEQFEIIGCSESEGKGFSNGLWKVGSKIAQPMINGKKTYKRIFIKYTDTWINRDPEQ